MSLKKLNDRTAAISRLVDSCEYWVMTVFTIAPRKVGTKIAMRRMLKPRDGRAFVNSCMVDYFLFNNDLRQGHSFPNQLLLQRFYSGTMREAANKHMQD